MGQVMLRNRGIFNRRVSMRKSSQLAIEKLEHLNEDSCASEEEEERKHKRGPKRENSAKIEESGGREK